MGDAPTLSPARVVVPPLRPLLGVGTHFVLRELVRKGIVTNPAVHSFCFVPVRSVRETACEWGAAFGTNDPHETLSRTVYDICAAHTDDPSFNRAFDIALRESNKHVL